MEFKSYGKIYRLGTEETEGILEGTVYVQEKLDGANASIWVDDNFEIHVGSRNFDVTSHTEGNFVKLREFVMAHEGIKSFILSNPHLRIYGEWLIKHTINYDATAYFTFYMFEIQDQYGNVLPIEYMLEVAGRYAIPHAPLLAKLENPTRDEVEKLAGGSAFGKIGEGVVIKNMEFRNKFGDVNHAKFVTAEFKEENAATFGNGSRREFTYVDKYVDVPRVKKIMNKIETIEGRKLELKDTPRIANSVYHDFITEEAWTIAKENKTIDFALLGRTAQKKAINVFKSLVTGEAISVAYQNITNE